MTANDLLYRLRVAGIDVSAHGDKLRLRAKRGALSDALRAEIQAVKFELIQLLRSETQERQLVVATGSSLQVEESRADTQDADICPPEYMHVATCSGCGPVVLRRGASNRVTYCPWCFRRRAGKPFPLAPGCPLEETTVKNAP